MTQCTLRAKLMTGLLFVSGCGKAPPFQPHCGHGALTAFVCCCRNLGLGGLLPVVFSAAISHQVSCDVKTICLTLLMLAHASWLPEQ
jgi:hypothetical protein